MSNLHGDLLDLLDKLQYSLIEEYFGFVSDEIDDILDQTGSPGAKLLALRDVMRASSVWQLRSWRIQPVMKSTR
jgi:hypothetical protein